MDCKKCTDLLNDYLDGELDGKEFAEVEHHVGRCHHCKAELERLLKMRDLMAELKTVEVPEGEREAFIDALRARLASEGVPDHSKRKDLRPYLVVAIAAILILIALVSYGRRPQPPPMIGPAAGLTPLENAFVDRVIAGSLDDHVLATNMEFMSDPGLTSGQALAIWKVVKETHSDLFEPYEPVE
jgi:anti-sigma factor RsiW